MNEIKITISVKSLLTILAIGMLIWGLIVAKDIILFIFAGYIIASALFPVVDFLKTKMPQTLAVALVFGMLIIILGVVFIPFAGILLDQLQQFQAYFPKLTDQMTEWINIYQNSSISQMLPPIEQISSKIFAYSESMVKTSLDFTLAIFGMIVALFTLAALVLFILLDRESLKTGMLSFFPKEKRENVRAIAETITLRVGGYVRGQLFIMFCVGVVTGVVMQLMGVPFALLLGIIAGILEVIPIIGPILAAVPAVILALLVSPWLFIWVILAYLVIQRVENLISPLVYGKFLDMPPLVIISVILIAGATLGVFGVVLSPAIAAAIYVLIQELYLKKINEK
ncbi:MAG: AI-2E family transporter [bacterium]|nr:AI-2E family transporter [bacterium]